MYTLNLPADLPAVSSDRIDHHIVNIDRCENREQETRRGISSHACCLLPHHRTCSCIRHQNDVRHDLLHNHLAVDALVRIRELHFTIERGEIDVADLVQ